MKVLVLLIFLFVLSGCNNEEISKDIADYDVLNKYTHDVTFYTQGLEFAGDSLIESTGKYNYSRLIKYDHEEGEIFDSYDLPGSYFGEGITVLDGKIFQLTYKSGICFVYNLSDFKKIGEFEYTGEGWGLTNDGTNLIMSNGTSTIFFRDPSDFSITGSISVKDSEGNFVMDINELEYVEGLIYANIYHKEWIVAIDPSDGQVRDVYDLYGLRNRSLETNPGSDVLNGIAYKDSSFFVTGKYWPYIFEIRLNTKKN
ncbi:MAG: glutaminyl-peptide cyclotransferase [Candidatus Delongbacteria bacterium]